MTTDSKSPVSRRDMVGKAGIAAVGAAASLAHASTQANQTMDEQRLQNPADKYPKPPFKKQSQPWPGLASKMNPRPDHGEDKLPRLGPARRAARR